MVSRFARLLPAMLVLALLVPALPSPPARAASTLEWTYDVGVDDPASGTATVTVTLRGVEGILKNITFLTDQHGYDVTDVGSDTSKVNRVRGGYALEVEEDEETFRFTVDVRRSAAKAGEYNAYLGEDWGVFRSEAFSLPYSYLFYGGSDFNWRGKLRFSLPDGWRAEGPWARDPAGGSGAFLLPVNETLPRGFVALGPFEPATSSFSEGREFRYVRLGNESDFEAKLFGYLAAATPFYEGVYGPATGRVILAVSAPAPMFRGGLGAPDSFYVRDGSDLRTVAHEYAHVYQLFGTKGQAEDFGEASLWVNEGDADYHGLLSLFATDEWSLDRVNEQLRKWDDERDESPFDTGLLVEATYASPLEDLAYHKGALVLHALDREIKKHTGGAKGVADLLQALNEAHDPRVREPTALESSRRTAPVTNEEVQETASRIAGVDLARFFNRYVRGTGWPPLEPVAAEGALVLTDLTLTPEKARQGEPVVASVTLVNRGLSDAEKRVTLTVDGEEVGTETLRLPRAATRVMNFTFTSVEPGVHEVRALYLEKTLHVLLPSDFNVTRISTLPATPTAREPLEVLAYVFNAGEVEGTTTVTVQVDGRAAAAPKVVTVPGGVSQAVSFTITVQEGGVHKLLAQATRPEGGFHDLERALVFREPPPGRGVSEGPPGTQTGQGPIMIPGFAWGALLGVVAAASRFVRRA